MGMGWAGGWWMSWWLRLARVRRTARRVRLGKAHLGARWTHAGGVRTAVGSGNSLLCLTNRLCETTQTRMMNLLVPPLDSTSLSAAGRPAEPESQTESAKNQIPAKQVHWRPTLNS